MGYNLPINGVYWGYNPFTNHLLTSWDIQASPKEPFFLVSVAHLYFRAFRNQGATFHQFDQIPWATAESMTTLAPPKYWVIGVVTYLEDHPSYLEVRSDT